MLVTHHFVFFLIPIYRNEKRPRGIIPLEGVKVQQIFKMTKDSVFEIFNAFGNSNTIKSAKTDSRGAVVQGNHKHFRSLEGISSYCKICLMEVVSISQVCCRQQRGTRSMGSRHQRLHRRKSFRGDRPQQAGFFEEHQERSNSTFSVNSNAYFEVKNIHRHILRQ